MEIAFVNMPLKDSIGGVPSRIWHKNIRDQEFRLHLMTAMAFSQNTAARNSDCALAPTATCTTGP